MEINKVIFFLIYSILISNQLFANRGIRVQATYVLESSQISSTIKKEKPSQVYLLYSGVPVSKEDQGSIFRNDTLINLKKFNAKYSGNRGYRLIFMTGNQIDSARQYDLNYQLTAKAINLGEGLLKIYAYDSILKISDEFIFNYEEKLKEKTRGRINGIEKKGLAWLLRQYVIYDAYDRNNYAVGSVWLLSIGIDDYGKTKYRTCKSDAQSFSVFFKDQFVGNKSRAIFNPLFHEYVLLDKEATKANIISALKDISQRATNNDYFIFNFSGCSNVVKNESGISNTHFFPFDVEVDQQSGTGAKLVNRSKADTTEPSKNCISLKELQEYIQLIPANNQLFISEAGPSKKFKTEFIKTLMQNSSEVAGILNKNRIIVVPNGFGSESVICNGEKINKGPINYYFTSLDSSENIYNLFRDDNKAEQLASQIENKAYNCKSFSYNYFDIFFEKQFLQQYREIFGEDESGDTRGLKKNDQKKFRKQLKILRGNIML